MRPLASVLARLRRKPFARDQRGVAAIEFAFISTFMLAMVSGAVDLTYSITIQRDLNRAAAEIAQALASCKRDETCFITSSSAISQRIGNIAPQMAGVAVGMAIFDEKNSRIENIVGNMTYLPADMQTSALAMLQEGDKGIAVLMTYTHQPIILGLAQDWGFTVKNFRAPIVTLSERGAS